MAPDGTILVAGEGKLLRLAADGKVMSEAGVAPCRGAARKQGQLREEVIEQHKQQAEMLPQMLEAYDKAMARWKSSSRNWRR